MRKPTVTLTATDPTGVQHTTRTSAGYGFAGFVEQIDRTWTLISKGWVHSSVRKHAAAYAHRSRRATGRVEVTAFLDPASAVPAAAARYFAEHPYGPIHCSPALVGTYTADHGWTFGHSVPLTHRTIAKLGSDVTSVAVDAGGYIASFTRTELTSR